MDLFNAVCPARIRERKRAGNHNPQMETRQKIWNGQVPVKFYDHSSADRQNCCFLMVSRLAYLPLLTPVVRKQLLSTQPSGNEEVNTEITVTVEQTKIASNFTGTDMDVWYSATTVSGVCVPLKWHYPVGLLYDLIMPTDKSERDSRLPWSIAVHFNDPYPSEQIIPMPSYDAPQQHFISMLKQADYIRSGGGSARNIMSMTKQEQTKLWDGLWSGNFDRFWQSNGKLMAAEAAGPSDLTQQCLPIRLYFYSTDSYLLPPLQRQIKAYKTADDKFVPVTVSDLLTQSLSSDSSSSSSSSSLLLHGIRIPAEAELIWLWENMSFADNFLHLIVLIS